MRLCRVATLPFPNASLPVACALCPGSERQPQGAAEREDGHPVPLHPVARHGRAGVRAAGADLREEILRSQDPGDGARGRALQVRRGALCFTGACKTHLVRSTLWLENHRCRRNTWLACKWVWNKMCRHGEGLCKAHGPLKPLAWRWGRGLVPGSSPGWVSHADRQWQVTYVTSGNGRFAVDAHQRLPKAAAVTSRRQ